MTTPASGTLTTDFEMMTAVAGRIDVRNDELRAMLRAFMGRMAGVPTTVWGGAAAARFRDVVGRWDAESHTLYTALQRISENIRANERTLREVADSHSHAIAATGNTL
ncbi:WXG100 family type VII secretion target [Mycolicibacterium arenosum]|uniref:ESAT-6-like protein n=1 Tax=Mycolicibacterium arenosum TaxID=2952157 RepID=A0ABT1M8I6_9MYCO|nr:WXG100 family type VII secretion target [Mycolicibacterium sp. CAU 1645]MCP9275479.1 WXG100 family type VII secretion target [Mycolicibacterium sp. CAU 1645]